MLSLGPLDVHLWVVLPESIDDDATLEHYRALLNAEERARQERIIVPGARHLDLVTRALVRTTLSRYVDRPAAALSFERGPHGRPELAPGQCGLPLRFNLSHTSGLVACAVTVARQIGVDVESAARETDSANLARRFFSAEEAATLVDLPVAARRLRFLKYWTLKEAYLKACGKGLALPLNRVVFDLPARKGDPIGVRFAPELGEDEQHWHFSLLDAGPTHVMALALSRDPDEQLSIETRWVRP